MNKGKFIVFEGIDGCGKSTQLERLNGYLEGAGVKTLVTREPGGDDISEKIRDIILDPGNNGLTNECETLLYLASRAQHVSSLIKPALISGKTVLCDRFEMATFAYQGYGRGLDLEPLRAFNRFAVDCVRPDLTLVFDMPVSEARKRMEGSGKAVDRIEKSNTVFFERVRKGFTELSVESGNSVVVDATAGIDEVFEEVLVNIKQILTITESSEP